MENQMECASKCWKVSAEGKTRAERRWRQTKEQRRGVFVRGASVRATRHLSELKLSAGASVPLNYSSKALNDFIKELNTGGFKV
jgi:hypothetical protein